MIFLVYIDKKTMFSPTINYKELDDAKLNELIDAFQDRMESYYFKAFFILQEATHQGFMEMAIACIVLDGLAGFYYGLKGDTSSEKYKEFLNEVIPQTANKIDSEIIQEIKKIGENKNISTLADAIYDAYRCGIIHETRIKAYGKIGALDGPDFYTWIKNKLIIDPGKFMKRIETFFYKYLEQLRNDNEILIKRFKTRFYHVMKQERQR